MAICYLLLAGVGQATTIRYAYVSAHRHGRHTRHARSAIRIFGTSLATGVVLAGFIGADGVAVAMGWIIGGLPTQDLLDTSRLVGLAGLALAAAVPAHLTCAMLRARGKVSAALGILLVGHWGVSISTMALLSWLGFGAAGIWLALSSGALTSSAVTMARKGKRSRRISRQRYAKSAVG